MTLRATAIIDMRPSDAGTLGALVKEVEINRHGRATASIAVDIDLLAAASRLLRGRSPAGVSGRCA